MTIKGTGVVVVGTHTQSVILKMGSVDRGISWSLPDPNQKFRIPISMFEQGSPHDSQIHPRKAQFKRISLQRRSYYPRKPVFMPSDPPFWVL